LTNYSEISDTIRPILSLLIELAGKRVLSIPDDRQRRFFFFIDEFGTLNNLPTIPIMLTNGRSKGMSVWIALQDMGQIDKIYGKEISQTIINSCATTFTFAANDPYTAIILSKKIATGKSGRPMSPNHPAPREPRKRHLSRRSMSASCFPPRS